jgi:hypothetical protein
VVITRTWRGAPERRDSGLDGLDSVSYNSEEKSALDREKMVVKLLWK